MHGLFLPRLGQTMEEAILADWLVDEDLPYDAGAGLYEVETEKITTSVAASLPGRILRRCVEPGSTIAVGTLLAVCADPDEHPSTAAIEMFIRQDSRGVRGADAEQLRTDPVSVEEGPAQRVTQGRARAMPRTRALARAEGVDIEKVTGTGPDGLVIPADVRAVVTLPAAHRRMAGTLAAGMVPQFTQMVDVDVTGWMAARAELGRGAEVTITFTDVILEAVVRSCAAVPEVNAAWTNDRLIRHRDVDIALAMDTPDGLLVPVIRHAQVDSLATRAARRHALAERARMSALTINDMGAGGITVSNLGAHGISTGIPLLVSPHAAIVFVGAMEPRVVVRSGGIAVRTLCSLAISFDHRVVDGVTAARFTARLRSAVEELTTNPTE